TAPPPPLARRCGGRTQGNTSTPRTNLLPGTGNAGTNKTGTGNTGQGTIRSGKTTGNLDGVPRSGNLPPGGIDLPGGTNRGGQPTIRNFQQPGGDSKGGGSKVDGGARGPGRSGGQNDAGGGNTGGNNPPPGAKGKKQDKG